MSDLKTQAELVVAARLYGAEAIVATGLTKWFGEGESKTTAVKDVALVAHFGEMLFVVGSA
jgi:hypothetical protein